MQAAWGNFALPVNAAEVTSQATVIQSTDYGAPLRYLVAYNVKVWLDGNGQQDLTRKENALRAALLVPNQSFALFTDSGSVSSAKILVGETASGTRVVQIGAPEAQGAEFVNRRTITFTVTAEYHVKNAARAIVSWREQVTIIGNGRARRSWRMPINGFGLRQTITPFSLVRATQQGQGVGYLARPSAPPPYWPDYLVNESETGALDTPQYMGGTTFINWPVSWSYQFERGDGRLAAVPLLPPGVI